MILAIQILLPMGAVSTDTPGLAPRRSRPVGLPQPLDDRAILAAPIFAPDRRPGAAGGTMGGADSPMAGYAAVGAATGGTVATAVVALPNGQAQVMRRGDTVDGWRLAGVERSRLIFDRQGERHILVVGVPATPLDQPSDQIRPRAGVR